MTLSWLFLSLLSLVWLLRPSHGILWTHSAVLDGQGDFHLYWIPGENFITFEIQARRNEGRKV